MKIAVCVKRVPTTEVQAKVGGDGKSLDVSGFQYMLSFYDELAVEQAIQAKEQLGGEVVVLTIGPADATKELRECLAKGADSAILLQDEAWMERDARATAKLLAEKLREIGAELVFAGRVATDRDNAAVGAMLGTYLGWATVTDVCVLELSESGGTAKRESEAGIETLSFGMPAVITCDKGLNEPRYAGLKGIMAAKKKPVEQVDAGPAERHVEIQSLALPAPRKEGRVLGEGSAAVPALIEALQNEAQVL